jgi:hypothetical protein
MPDIAATIAEIQTALAAARVAGITPADMVALLDVAIAAPAALDGKLVASYSIAGRSQTLAIRDAMELRKYYHDLAKDDASNGGFVPQWAEFRA